MARGALSKVAKRLLHTKRRNAVNHSGISSTNNPNVFSTHGTPNTLSGQARLPTSSLFIEGIDRGIANLNDDEEIRKQLTPTNGEITPTRVHTNGIDTHALVKFLIESGFSPPQAEALTTVMVRVTGDNVDSLQSSMVSKSQADLTLQKVASQLAILRRDMMIMEKTDFTELVTKTERLSYELEQLQRTTRDEIIKVESNLTLDLNLEKGKVKDMHMDHLRTVEAKHAVIFEKINNLDREIQNVRSLINTENAALQTIFERYKSDTIKFAFGSVATCMTIVLGFYRLWS